MHIKMLRCVRFTVSVMTTLCVSWNVEQNKMITNQRKQHFRTLLRLHIMRIHCIRMQIGFNFSFGIKLHEREYRRLLPFAFELMKCRYGIAQSRHFYVLSLRVGWQWDVAVIWCWSERSNSLFISCRIDNNRNRHLTDLPLNQWFV